jgi:hypothetical protein
LVEANWKQWQRRLSLQHTKDLIGGKIVATILCAPSKGVIVVLTWQIHVKQNMLK